MRSSWHCQLTARRFQVPLLLLHFERRDQQHLRALGPAALFKASVTSVFLPVKSGPKYTCAPPHSSSGRAGLGSERKQVCNDHWPVEQWHRGGHSNKWLRIKFQFAQEAVANQEGHCPRSSSATSKIHQLPAPGAGRAGSCFHTFALFFPLIATLFHIFSPVRNSSGESSDAAGRERARRSGVCNFPNSGGGF